MSEGPQVKLCAERLHRWLSGRRILSCVSDRTPLSRDVAQITGKSVRRVFCKGKRIFIDLDDGWALHNHLLMRGKWRKRSGQFAFIPPGAWLLLYMGPYTVLNYQGQVLELLQSEGVHAVLNSLGPDCMARTFPDEAAKAALRKTPMRIAEALLDQSILSGIGNIARSEVLFLAQIDPRKKGIELSEAETERLCKAIVDVLWDSYSHGGRWTCRVYRRSGQPCDRCGRKICLIRLSPSRRSTYFCASCQSDATLFSGG